MGHGVGNRKNSLGARGVLRGLFKGSPLERATFLRHLAISGAAVAAFALRRELHVSGGVLWVLGVAALANMVTVRLSDAPAWAGVARAISPVFGVGGWAALVFLTGGAMSPLVAGFWLEIIFSAMVLPPVGTLLVTAGVAVALWLEQSVLGRGTTLGRLWLQTGFVGAIGLLTFYASRRWRQEQQALSGETKALNRRLGDLEKELEDARTLGQVGERAARLAHSLKNTVHSLRGFTRLIEAPTASGHAQKQALDGLRLAIDGLEGTARAALRPSDSDSKAKGATTASELRRTLDQVIAEVARDHAGVRWVKHSADCFPSVAVPSALLREVFMILARNAAEASGASGEVVLRAELDRGALRLVVQDRGPGIDPRLRETLFQPGVTTKPSGSGFGLFLARRLVESRGGELTVAEAVQGGALVSVRLPLLPS
jgi:two-component system, NtrC family, sensor histidine kinase HydH